MSNYIEFDAKNLGSSLLDCFCGFIVYHISYFVLISCGLFAYNIDTCFRIASEFLNHESCEMHVPGEDSLLLITNSHVFCFQK